MDFARRAYDHSFRFDPIVRSLLDTDFYKLAMLQLIWERHPLVEVTFAVTNRTKSVRLAEELNIDEVRQQLDHVRSLRFEPSDIVYLRGQTFYGKQGFFKEGFLDFLRHLRLPDYNLAVEDGQIVLEFTAAWPVVTLWEIYALEILNELRYRKIMSTMSKSGLDIMYARAKVKLYEKLLVLRDLPGLNLTDFGTRRRHSHLWQEHCIATAKEVLGDKFTGTSNVFFARKHDLEPKGTNAHELPMVLAALANNDEELYDSQYRVLREWRATYDGNLLMMLPDTFGTAQFLKGLDPVTAITWKGARPDSKEPIEAGEELIKFWGDQAENKLIIFSDGLDVAIPGHRLNGSDIPTIHKHFSGRVGLGYGWGTNLTNDFLGCHPDGYDVMKPLSLVCKVKSANGRPAIKLSDNPTKATGPKEELDRYMRVFGWTAAESREALV